MIQECKGPIGEADFYGPGIVTVKVLNSDVVLQKQGTQGVLLFCIFVRSIDAHGLLRAAHSRKPTPYSHIAGFSPRFYAHIGGGFQTPSST